MQVRIRLLKAFSCKNVGCKKVADKNMPSPKCKQRHAHVPISQALISQVKAFPVGVVLMFCILAAHIQKQNSLQSYIYFFVPC